MRCHQLDDDHVCELFSQVLFEFETPDGKPLRPPYRGMVWVESGARTELAAANSLAVVFACQSSLGGLWVGRQDRSAGVRRPLLRKPSAKVF